MYYFRAIPDFKLIKYFISNLFLKGIHKVDHLQHVDHSPFLFSYSRDAMNILIKKSYQELNRKVNIHIPNLFCWEIISEFNKSEVNISYYELNEDLRIISFPKGNIDIFLYVDLFGITEDISEIKKICKNQKIKLFIDQAHCLKLTRKPDVNEFIFLSLYKHYPIYDGAALIVNKINENEILEYLNKFEFKNHSKIKLLTWILKSIYVSMSSRMRYVTNEYDYNNKIINLNKSHFYKMSSISINTINREFSKVNNIKTSYSFYDSIISLLKQKFNIKLINKEYMNSHLFALKFENNIDSLKVYNIFKKLKLPIISWPEKKYINNIPINIQKKSIDIIDKLIFLPSFYNNSISDLKKNKILNQIHNYINEN